MSDDFETRKRYFDQLAIGYHVEQEYRPKDPPREPHPLKVFKSVHLPLSPDLWCEIAMSEGDEYLGGCCGAMSRLQDVINHIFRFDAGWASTEQLEDIALTLIEHGDFEGRVSFEKKPDSLQALVDDAARNWDQFSAWDRIALCWQILQDFYAPKVPRTYGSHLSEVDKAVALLSRSLEVIGWEHLFKSEQNDGGPTGQQRANRAIILSRVMPALKTLTEKLGELSLGPVEGFALIDKEAGEDAIAHNGRGLCILETRKEVDELLALWKRQQEEYEVQERKDIDKLIGVRPVRVSMENGVEFLA